MGKGQTTNYPVSLCCSAWLLTFEEISVYLRLSSWNNVSCLICSIWKSSVVEKSAQTLIGSSSEKNGRAFLAAKQRGIRSDSTDEMHLFSSLLDSPRCSSKTPFLPDILTARGRPINLTCHMNNGNPSKINFTWLLPNGHIRLGHRLNATSSYITVIPQQIDEFGPIICRAQNHLGLFGQCHLKMILGGLLLFPLTISRPLCERDTHLE